MAVEINPGFTGFDQDATPNPVLLLSDCVGCHASDGGDPINENGVPIVFNMVELLNNPLAGGNFRYVPSMDGDAKGHNVRGLTAPDPAFQGKNVPGSETNYDQLTCAGTRGCHGDRSIEDELDAIKDAHHTDDSGGIDGSSVGLSYRFLDQILGIEDGDWERDNTNISHNEYQGSTSPATDTISYLCATCHGKFHTWEGGAGEVGTGSPWLRHPTDIILPADREYQYYNDGPGGTAAAPYSMVAPLARPDLASIADTSEINPGTDVVMCLSCHRAHGSPYFKMMRWNYRDWPGTVEPLGSKGCATCHTWKD